MAGVITIVTSINSHRFSLSKAYFQMFRLAWALLLMAKFLTILSIREKNPQVTTRFVKAVSLSRNFSKENILNASFISINDLLCFL